MLAFDARSDAGVRLLRRQRRANKVLQAIYGRITRVVGIPAQGGRVRFVDGDLLGIESAAVLHDTVVGDAYSVRCPWRVVTHVWTIVAPVAALEASLKEHPTAVAVVRRGARRLVFTMRKGRGYNVVVDQAA